MAPEETPASEIASVEQPGAQPEPPVPPEQPLTSGTGQPEQPQEQAEGAGQAPPPPPPPQAPEELPPPPVAAPVQAPSEPKVMAAEWPCAGYSGPQPWEADNPPALTQNHLMLSSGSAGPEVVELAALLAHLGYGSSISAGDNPHAIYDSGVSDAVRAFCADYGVAEDPKVLAARTADTVGPWLWEALVRAAYKKLGGEEA